MSQEKKSQENTSNLVSINNLNEKINKNTSQEEEIIKLKALLKAQEDFNARLLSDIDEKNDIISALKRNINEKSIVESIILTEEEEIALYQLEMLKDVAKSRALTLEEVKKYDLLVKNKRLAQGSSTINANYERLPKNLPKTELIKIAQLSQGSDDEQ